MMDFSKDSLRLYFQNNSQPISQFFIDMSLLLGRKILADRTPGLHYANKHVAQQDGLHIAGNKLKGNLGRIAFQDPDGYVHGLGWVGPSTRAKIQMTQFEKARGDNTVVMLPTKKQIRAASNFGEKVFPPFFKTTGRRHDSEYLLFNYLDNFLQYVPTSIGGEIVLVSERVPCFSCSNVIFRFAKKYYNLKISVIYFYETEGRDPRSLVELFSCDVRLYKFAMSAKGADGIQILPSTPHMLINGKVLEQAEEADFSAHIGSWAQGFKIKF